MTPFWIKKTLKSFLTKEEEEHIVKCIQEAERNTSGEIRVYIETNCDHDDAMYRAKEVFATLEMEQTQFKNAVIIYIAFEDRKLALYGDEGIYTYTGGPAYWEEILKALKIAFRERDYGRGIGDAVLSIGQSLSKYFPYDQKGETNELPDDIVYGK